MLQYKGYIGHVVFDDLNELFFGEIINTQAVITFQATMAHHLKKAFMEAIDHYLKSCEKQFKEPEVPLLGQLTLTISPELHRDVFMAAKNSGVSLNVWICSALRHAVCRH
ncbi:MULTISPECIES: type II toxin-antitoxin system HicB family antitoxin [Legionella]|uniref:Type II toxin-antitoxin system HicB family antitoxin n=1 Tax=Legionella bononiensis TaxID=2793102 RepID=A0ABS1W7B7_9GAMM|nr:MULTISPECIES: type II toxin-antitoxin system HicB family antitoxin [Legionella]MBL7478489.1 type II toxin-antitoxin system HicB family antitoxin [Legionella bononiensis]MBL7525256.1 type II toxin-antitoxin system HicB family antitoxin [Legionella bononiensis]MBL7561446.1 type II toxin-antitoxin system HicB family antitoxin [Legionella bononiensis]HAU1025076.1 type II toxin-antitoxin system HicB family antitoxin [Legionella pneumophila]